MYNTKYDALYTRQSIDKKDSISIESQFSMCEHEVRGKEFKKYSDRGYSGKNLNRPDFERLMEDIRNGLIKRVVVYKLDRISRSILDFSGLMLFFQEHDVEFVSVTEKFDTSTPVGRAMLNICIVFAQLERETIQQRITDAYYSRNKRGFFMGGVAPYGFQKESTVIDGIRTSKFVIDEEQSAQVKLLYSMYADSNNSLHDIVKYLVANNIKQVGGKDWSTPGISALLRSPVYVQSDLAVYEFFKSQGANIINDVSEFDGRGCYLFTGTVSTSRKQNDLKDKEIVIAPHEGFISSDLWLKCRLRCLNNKRSAKTCKGKNSWLVGKIKCGNCGYAIAIGTANTKWARYGLCSNKMSKKICKGTGGTIYIDLLEEYVFNAIKGKLAEFQTLSDYSKNAVQPKVRENELKLVQIDNEIDELLGKVAGANAILMEYINQKIEELDGQRRKLQQENVSMSQTAKGNTLNTAYSHVENWEKLSFDDKQTIVDVLIQVIHISNGEIIINWNI